MRHTTLIGRLKDRLTLLFSKLTNTLTGNSRRRPDKRRHQLSNAEYHLSIAELNRLIAAATNVRDRLLIRLMVETGIRRCEVAALTSSDLDISRNVIMIRSGKGNKTRVVPLTTDLVRRLSKLASESDEPVFHTRNGTMLTLRQINRIVAAAGERAGLSNPNPKQQAITCHLLRHSFARHWKAAGGSIETLSKILGHSSVKTTWDQYGTEGLDDIVTNYNKTLTLMQRRH